MKRFRKQILHNGLQPFFLYVKSGRFLKMLLKKKKSHPLLSQFEADMTKLIITMKQKQIKIVAQISILLFKWNKH